MKKLGLTLGGGGARGLAHIGVLKVLAAEGIPIFCLSGSSMGGIIAAAYATGMSPEEIEDHALRFSRPRELLKLVDIKPPRRGLVEGKRVRSFLTSLFGTATTFADLKYPLALCAVDLIRACTVSLCEGNLLDAVLATSGVPGLFPSQEIGDYRLVDGGVLNNVPVDLARGLGADVVLAVAPQHEPSNEPLWQDLPNHPRWPTSMPKFLLDFYRAELIMIAELTRFQLAISQPEVVLRPAVPPEVTMFMGFRRAAEVIAIGEETARQALPELLKLVI